MDLDQALLSRRSIRCFRPDPVPREVLRGLLERARWSPSWANSQCWQVYAVTGEPLERLKASLHLMEANECNSRPDFRMPSRKWPGPMQEYSQALIRALNEVRSGQPAGEPGSRRDFFGAPCLVLLAVDKTLVPEYACFDSGLFAQAFCLAGHGQGLGTCILAMAVRHPDILRKLLPDAADKAFVIGIAVGYPEPEAPINTFERPRAALADFVTWVD